MAEQDECVQLAPRQEMGQRVSPFYVERKSSVKINPGDTFVIEEWIDGKKHIFYSLGKPALMKLAALAGISFRLDREVIEREYVLYRYEATMKMPDGTVLTMPGTKEWDASVILPPIMDAIAELEEQVASTKDEAAKKKLRGKLFGKRTQLQQVKETRIGMTETKAMLRAIRNVLGLKPKYEAAELKEPIEITHYDYSPDYSDPNVLKVLAIQSGASTDALFGVQNALPSVPEVEAVIADDSFTVTDGLTIPESFEDEPEDGGEPEPVVEEEKPKAAAKKKAAPKPEPEPEPEPEEVPEFEDVEPEPEFEVSPEAEAEASTEDDPALYVIDEESSVWNGSTLGDVEKSKPGYCRFIAGGKRGSEALQAACARYIDTYLGGL